MADDATWRLTDRERRQAISAAVSALSTMLGPIGPIAVWGFEYFYDRRDLLFSTVGTPVRAYTADSSALSLTALSADIAQPRLPQSTLSIDTSLTASARRLGLRNGDPVSVTVTGHRYVQARSGLVVPTRIGERVNVTVPSGSYSIAAFGSRQENLFSSHDPYNTVAGDNVTAYGRRQVALPLTARASLASASGSALTPARSTGGTLATRTCLWCGEPLTLGPFLHMQTCTQSPAPTRAALSNPQAMLPSLGRFATRVPAQPLRFDCDRCSGWFASSADLDTHMQNAHPFINWVRSLFDE